MEFIKPRHEHKNYLWLWNVIAYEKAIWSVEDGLAFADYYLVQHKLFKRIKRVKCFGFRPKDHPKYKEFCEQYKV